MTTKALISELKDVTTGILNETKAFKALTEEELNHQPSPGKWSALECLEHLNRYGDFYIPEIKKRLQENKPEPTENYTPGLLGNYFVNSVKPGAKDMNTFDNMNPSKSTLRPDVLNVFIEQQTQMLNLLDQSALYNLKKVKTSISISKLLRLRLGDTLRVVIYHNQRHMEQAQRALTTISKNEKAAV